MAELARVGGRAAGRLHADAQTPPLHFARTAGSHLGLLGFAVLSVGGCVNSSGRCYKDVLHGHDAEYWGQFKAHAATTCRCATSSTHVLTNITDCTRMRC